jgi:MFS family permease
MYRQLRPVPSLLPKIGAGGGDFKHGLLYAKLFYFFFFAAIGCLVPYLNVYFAQQGLSGAQIGWLGSVAPLIALTANPAWGAIADRWNLHRQVLSLCAIGAGLISLLYLVVESFWPLMIVTIVLTFFRTPIGSLLDSSVLDMVRRIGAHYGRQRFWGSVGFVLVTLGLSQYITLNDLSILFWIHGLFLAVICGALALMLPIGAKRASVSLIGGLKQLAKKSSYMSFLGAMALLGVGTSSYVNFTGLHMLEVGGDQQWLAWAWAANGLTEAPMMFLGARWFARFRYSRLLLIGFAGYTVVWALMAMANTPQLLVLCAAANGVCYGTLWSAAVNYAGEAAPEGLSATAQALVGAAQSGIGWSIGSVAAGYLWDAAGGNVVFAMASCAALAAGVLFWVGNRRLQIFESD